MKGGNPFYISLKECLPEDVSSGFAVFRAVGTVELIKLDNFKFFGLKIPGEYVLSLFASNCTYEGLVFTLSGTMIKNHLTFSFYISKV